MAASEERGTKGNSRARDAMRRHEVLAAGIVTGLAGGLAMLGVAVLGATWHQLDPVHALDVIGETFVGPEAFDGVAVKLTYGALVHLATSVGFAILLAAIVPRDVPVASAIGIGVGLALLALMLMMSLVVPWANPGFRSGMQDIGGTWVLAHGAFGAVLGTSPDLRRWLARDARADLPRAGLAQPPPARRSQPI